MTNRIKYTKYGGFAKTRQKGKISFSSTKNVNKVSVVKLNLPPAYNDEDVNELELIMGVELK